MKAAIGLVSDAVPLFGYHKRSYIVMLSVVGSISLITLSFYQLTPSLAFLGALFLFLFQLQVASVDLLTEGKYAELMVKRPETGSDLVSFAWGLQSAGALFGCVISAVMISKFEPRFMFLVALPLAAQVVIPTLTGKFPEKRLPENQRGIRFDRLNEFPDLFKLAVVMTIGALLVGGSGFGSPLIQSNVSIFVSFTLAYLGFKWLPPVLRRANLYLFLNNMLYVSIQGAMDYWMTADEKCVPNGPHFSMSFYISYGNLIGSLASVIGVIIFQVYLSRSKFRTAFLFAGVVKVAASIFDFIIIKRYNKKLGISDSVFFTMGDAVIFQAINRIELMPAIVLTSKVCPPGMESSVYALLVSYQNLGIGVSRTFGDFLIDRLGILTTEPCNFDRLPLAVLIAHVALPSLIFPLIYFLIPDANMTDDLVNGDDGDDNRQDAGQRETDGAFEIFGDEEIQFGSGKGKNHDDSDGSKIHSCENRVEDDNVKDMNKTEGKGDELRQGEDTSSIND